jgi:hypothetical protein
MLQCCADDLRSIFSAARAHSRLHQAAVQALSSITAGAFWQQERVEGLLMYLARHSQHVDSLDLLGNVYEHIGIRLRQLPENLNLSSLILAHWELQLQPGDGFQGVVRPGLPIKQLRLHDCTLLDGTKGLAAALSLLPGLQHLSISATNWTFSWGFKFPIVALSALQQLTHLEFVGAELYGPDKETPALQPLQSLTRLQDLRLSLAAGAAINSSMLSGAQHLTRVKLMGRAVLEPGALTAVRHLQHLEVALYNSSGRTAGLARLLSELQHVQQLTFLRSCDVSAEADAPPAAAFSALTASSKLQHLDISRCTLPAGVWQHLFPVGRQLPELQFLDISDVKQSRHGPAPAPEGSCLVSCCPGLQQLGIMQLQCSAERLSSLTGLSKLHTLCLAAHTRVEGVEAVCQLTGLRELILDSPESPQGLLLQLAQLKQLTHLYFSRTGTTELMGALWGLQTVKNLRSEVCW